MKLFLIVFILINVSCQSQIKKQELINDSFLKRSIKLDEVNGNVFTLVLPTQQKVEIKNDIERETSFLNIDGIQTPLKFYLAREYIGEIHWIKSVSAGEFLLIESFQHGVSGLAASVVNATMINLTKDNFEPIYFNSFHWDIEKNLNIENDTLEIEILDLHNRGEELYCASYFYLTKRELKSTEKSMCYILRKGELKPISFCENCMPLQMPYVME